MKYKYKGIIFDLDGTLVDTIEDIASSLNRVLREHDYPEHDPEEYKAKVGWGVQKLAFLSLPLELQKNEKEANEIAKKISASSSAYYAENPLVYSKPYPGINEVLSVLRQKKIKTAVLTNKPDIVAQKVMAGLFPAGSFDFVRGEIIGGKRKPDPDCVWDILLELNLNPADIIFIGDSEIDMECANAAGCFPLGVDWGYRCREAISGGGARKIIQRPEELLEYFI